MLKSKVKLRKTAYNTGKTTDQCYAALYGIDFKTVELSFLSVMTMIYNSLILLLFIDLASSTFLTQQVNVDASTEGLSNPGGCISDWRGLKKAYLDRQSSADVENFIFNFYPSDAINFGVLVMFYDVGPTPNTSTSERRECCQQGSKGCIIHFIYRFKIFRDISPQLLRTCPRRS